VKRLPASLASLAALCALMFGLSGCNVRFSPYAAVVNGSEISQTQLRDALTAVVNNAGYKCSVASSGTTHIKGAGDGTYNAHLQRDGALDPHSGQGRTPGGREAEAPRAVGSRARRRRSAPGRLRTASGCTGTGASILAAFPASYRQLLVRFQLDEDALSAHLAGTTLNPGPLGAYVASHKTEMMLACVSVIETGTKATASSVRSQVLAGKSFADMARAHSIDSTTSGEGGVIGCIPDADFNAPLNKVIAGLTVGRVSSPVAFSSDWLLLLVSRRESETSQQLIPSLVAQEQSALNVFFPRILGSAKVELDPQYGTWSTKGTLARVQANTGPPADLVPNAAANAGPKVSG
jgi:hypothetical protein